MTNYSDSMLRNDAQTSQTDNAHVIGMVGSPPAHEATSETFDFWVPRGELVEKTQIIKTQSQIGGQTIEFYGMVSEVFRQSRKKNMGEEYDLFDGDVNYQPEFQMEGVTYATASILRTNPPVLTPPLEQCPVVLGNNEDASLAYGADGIENPIIVGLIKNGANATAGAGVIDLDYLLGVNGGHMNVNGSAGRGTKSSFLLFVIYQLLSEARRRRVEVPSSPTPMIVVPIILNVKGFDLFFIDHYNSRFNPDKQLSTWNELGVEQPSPFENARFFAPQIPNGDIAINVGRSDVSPYSWSLSNVIESGLFTYLFSDEDAHNDNFRALTQDIEAWLTNEHTHNDGSVSYDLNDAHSIGTFQQLLDWVRDRAMNPGNRELQGHETSTWRKLFRRLFALINDSRGILRRNDQNGHPLAVTTAQTTDPLVIDLYSLANTPSLQRFVVATILRQLIDDRTGANAIDGLVYIVALDELNRFAPRGADDPITELIELVAAEMRSRGIILLGAQQQASKVSEKVIENAAIRVLGCSGSLELNQPVWRSLSDSTRRKATSLPPDEKLIIQDSFREPMHVRVPFPVWAMRQGEAHQNDSSSLNDDVETF